MANIRIVGSGIIGCASAAHLIAGCHETTVFEKDISGLPASVGNAGNLAVPEIDPLARPDMLFAAPKWIMDVADPPTTGENAELAPFSIRRFQ
ncbi:FAD-dependent oxidoreductase [Sinorhizobium sp. 8-89]|uniref:FAD-dependent oxidoreductase n=1 Tax=Sinorhizobium sp. 7-81 TaxID=3049087 RepID=UPI0024C278BD|nr:FAD-dependent oxidoreductase [Sinorhizobium sp. 7-81]MDK1386138.1 FAD-dependent oxidoreductase [Sinorhizobium sp. 7-81]